MIRLPLVVGACLLVASAVGVGAFAPAQEAAGAVQADEPAGDRLADEPAGDRLADEPAGDRLLVVADAETDERLLNVSVSEGTTVALNYTHSVEKTPVLDVYEVNGTELEMVRMEFESYGAGLPAGAEVNVTEDGTFVFDPEGSYDRIYVTPGEIAGHELVVADRAYDLLALSDGRSVRISVANRSSSSTLY